MDILLIFEQMLMMLIFLLVGVAAAKAGLIDDAANRWFTRFNLLIPQTCMILSSALNAELDITPGRIATVLGAGVVMYAILVGLSLLTPVIYRCKPSDKGIYSFMTIFGNVGFMGIPVARAILGDEASFYAALLNIPFNLLAYTLGIALLNSGNGKTKVDWRLMINAPLVAAVAAIFLMCLHMRLPAPVTGAVDMLGDMIVPSSMIIIGASLGNQRLRDVFGDWHVYAFAPMRLIVVPVVLWAVMHLIVKDPVLLGTMTLMGAMPAAAFATMLSIQYGGNVQMASKTVFVTTVLSVVTIPLVCAILPL